MANPIAQSVIDARINNIRSALNCSEDEGFVHLAYNLTVDADEDEVPPDELVDGAFEKQIDIISVVNQANERRAVITIAQVKNVDGFSSNVLVLLSNGLAYAFEKQEKDLKALKNDNLYAKIMEIRELMGEYGPSKLAVHVHFITRGDTNNLSPEYKQERQALLTKWSAAHFGEFQFREYGAAELLECMRVNELSRQAVNVDIGIEYDVNQPSVAMTQSNDIKSVLCTISGKELARLASLQPENAIFEANVRRHLGLRGKVNSAIYQACTDPNQSKFFWFMNNGITMICDNFDPVFTDRKVKITNAQIVNGCQTSVTVRQAAEDQKLQNDVKVQLKIYATKIPEFVDNIVLATNHQNSIRARDLYANHRAQIAIQRAIKESFGYFYERKAGEFKDSTSVKRSDTINNEKAGQSYLAICLKQPSVARAQKYRIFEDDLYYSIYEDSDPGHVLMAYLIYSFCRKQARLLLRTSVSDAERGVATYGVFHVSRLVGYFLVGTDHWPKSNLPAFAKLLTRVAKGTGAVKTAFDRSVKQLIKLQAASTLSSKDWNNYTKSDGSQRDLNQFVAKQTSPKKPRKKAA